MAAHPDDVRMTLAEHLTELRRRIVISTLAVVAGTGVAFAFHHWLLRLLTHPYCHLPASYRFDKAHCALVVTGVLDAFTVTLKLSLYAGVILSSPIWLWQLWRFVTPGLHSNERRYAVAFVGTSVTLFGAGAVIAYFTLGTGLRFLLGFATGGITSLLTFDSYLSYVVAIVLVFAVSFEFPLLVVMLNLSGVLTHARLLRWTRLIVFGIFVFAAVATPSQDPFTMLALALPMCGLYGLAVGFAFLHDRRLARRGDTSPYAHLADDELSPLDDEPVTQ
ncbi:MAG: sec-independent protein translocase protein TatC [Frankiaceae bacterium]|nr:sec-independent protein translocase protein TatC [Frankiaceae bacterium]